MGIDLRLLPVDGDYPPHIFFSHQILSLDRNELLTDITKIAEKHGRPLPARFNTFSARQENGEHGYGEEHEDPYGTPLQYVLAKHLKPLAKKVGIVVEGVAERVTSWKRINDDVLESAKPKRRSKAIAIKNVDPKDGYQSRLNRAALAYICALPDDFKIVLFWH